MTEMTKNNRLLPWYIGIAVIFAAVIYLGYLMRATNCGISTPLAFVVLGIMPVVYLVLMYLTLTSQK